MGHNGLVVARGEGRGRRLVVGGRRRGLGLDVEVGKGLGGRRGNVGGLGDSAVGGRRAAKGAGEGRLLGEGSVDVVVDGLVDNSLLEEVLEFLLSGLSGTSPRTCR